jgi:hypothetical protein
MQNSLNFICLSDSYFCLHGFCFLVILKTQMLIFPILFPQYDEGTESAEVATSEGYIYNACAVTSRNGTQK